MVYPMKHVALVVCALFAVLAARPVDAATTVRLKHVAISVALKAPAKAGKTDWVAVHLKMAPGWHSYWRNPGETGLPTRIAWTLPKGVTAGTIHWPVPQRFRSGTIVDYGYAGAVTLLVPLTVAPGAGTATGVATAHVSWLLCAQMCIPQSATLTLPLDKASGDARLFAAAFAAQPKPFTGSAHYASDKNGLTLTLSGLSEESLKQPAQFFPATPRAVADDTAAQIRRVGNSLKIRFKRARHAKPFDDFAGVLALGTGQAFAVTATPAAATNGGGAAFVHTCHRTHGCWHAGSIAARLSRRTDPEPDALRPADPVDEGAGTDAVRRTGRADAPRRAVLCRRRPCQFSRSWPAR